MRRKVLISIVAIIIAVCAAIIVLQQTGIIGSSDDTTESIYETVNTDDDILPEDTNLDNEEISDKGTSTETTNSGEKASDTEETENSTGDEVSKQSTTANQATTKKATTSKAEATTSKSSNKKGSNSSTTSGAKTATTTKKGTTKKTITSKNNTTNKSSSKKSTTTAKQCFSVSIAISCKNALKYKPELPSGGYILAETKYTVKSGTTVMDLLKTACDKNGIELKCGSSYVTNIGGLKEKECTGASGWMYRVNGENVWKSASKCELSAGDSVEWYYVTSGADN